MIRTTSLPRLPQWLQLPGRAIRLASLAGLTGCAFSSLAQAASGTVSIDAAYSYSAPDYLANTVFTVTNDSDGVLTDIAFSALGDGSTGSTDTATWTWSGVSIAAGSSVSLAFGDASTSLAGSGWGFAVNYGYTYGGNDQAYSFSALLTSATGSTMLSASFTPVATSNSASFLGNDASGDYLPSDVAGTVASIQVSSVPEPGAALLLALGGAGLMLQFRRQVRAAR